VPEQFAGCFPRILCGSNPGNVGHAWVKSTFIMDGDAPVGSMRIRKMPDAEGGMKRQYIAATLDDNPTMAQDDPSYRRRIRGLGNEALVKAFEKGDWNAVVGSYLEGVWEEARHIVEPFPIPASWKVWRAMDWGFAKPYCVLWLAMDNDGCVYVWRELYGWGGKADAGSREEASAVAQKIIEIERFDEKLGYEYRSNPADSAIFAQIGGERSIGQIFRANGVKWVEAYKGPRSRVNGAQWIVELLKNDKLKVFTTCRHLIRTVPALMPDETNPEDVDTHMEDHAWDALRYGLLQVRRAPEGEAQAGYEGQHDMHQDASRQHFMRV
jgi:hypothetical protein